MRTLRATSTGDFYAVYLLGLLIAVFIFLTWSLHLGFWVGALIFTHVIAGYVLVPLLLGVGEINLENEWLGLIMGLFSMITLLILLLIVFIRRNRKIKGS